MKRALFLVMVLLLGVMVGGGAGYGAVLLFAKPGDAPVAPPPAPKRSFVSSTKILAPLVFLDGRLAGYVTFDIALEVPEDKAAEVTEKLPLLLHAINMRTWRTPLASGPDGQLASIGGFRNVVRDAAAEAFGRNTVTRIAITRAEPA